MATKKITPKKAKASQDAQAETSEKPKRTRVTRTYSRRVLDLVDEIDKILLRTKTYQHTESCAEDMQKFRNSLEALKTPVQAAAKLASAVPWKTLVRESAVSDFNPVAGDMVRFRNTDNLVKIIRVDSKKRGNSYVIKVGDMELPVNKSNLAPAPA